MADETRAPGATRIGTSGSAERTRQAPVSGTDWTGVVVGRRYRLERALNAGGMGTVYLAQNLTGNQKVVVKFPHAHLLGSRDFLERFDREVAAMQQLTHPHIVEIYDAGKHPVDDGPGRQEIPYLVVRYMSGGSLQDRIEEAGGRLTPRQLGWVASIADALDFMHAKGVVHRDVKPDNLLFDVHGTPYLTDFGIAKLVGGDVDLTAEGTFGSPHFMAPEFARRAFTPAFDQYSLAVVVYRALAGDLPHSGDSEPTLLANKLTKPPAPLAERIPGLPGSLADAVMRALSIDPHARFESCGAFADAMLDAIPEEGRSVWPRMLAAGALVVAASLAVYVWVPGPGSIDDVRGRTVEALEEMDAAALARQEERSLRAGELEDVRQGLLGIEGELARLEQAPLELPEPSRAGGIRAVRDALARATELLEKARAGDASLVLLRGQVSELRARAIVLEGSTQAAMRAGTDDVERLTTLEARVRGSSLNPEERSELAAEISTTRSRTQAIDEQLSETGATLDLVTAELTALPPRIERTRARLGKRERELLQIRASLAERERELQTRGTESVPPRPPPLEPTPRERAVAAAERKLVSIPAGSFLFGCAPGTDCEALGEAEGSRVDLPGFAIDRSEVTVAEYRACVDARACTPPQGLTGALCNWDLPGRDDHPVNCVYYDQASVYCDFVRKALPTEQQWERAARGTDGAPYPWGAEDPRCELAVYAGCSDSTRPVEDLAAGRNAHGLFGMAGNVFEWTRTAEGERYQVVRGGSFRNDARGIRSDRRSRVGRTTRSDGAGFRCARD